MKDTIIKGTGNSRYLKSAIPENITHQQLVDLLRNGTMPIDLNGVNMDGIEQLGTPLNTATLLQKATAALLGLEQDDPTVDDAFKGAATNLNKAMEAIDTTVPYVVAEGEEIREGDIVQIVDGYAKKAKEQTPEFTFPTDRWKDVVYNGGNTGYNWDASNNDVYGVEMSENVILLFGKPYNDSSNELFIAGKVVEDRVEWGHPSRASLVSGSNSRTLLRVSDTKALALFLKSNTIYYAVIDLDANLSITVYAYKTLYTPAGGVYDYTLHARTISDNFHVVTWGDSTGIHVMVVGTDETGTVTLGASSIISQILYQSDVVPLNQSVVAIVGTESSSPYALRVLFVRVGDLTVTPTQIGETVSISSTSSSYNYWIATQFTSHSVAVSYSTGVSSDSALRHVAVFWVDVDTSTTGIAADVVIEGLNAFLNQNSRGLYFASDGNNRALLVATGPKQMAILEFNETTRDLRYEVVYAPNAFQNFVPYGMSNTCKLPSKRAYGIKIFTLSANAENSTTCIVETITNGIGIASADATGGEYLDVIFSGDHQIRGAIKGTKYETTDGLTAYAYADGLISVEGYWAGLLKPTLTIELGSYRGTGSYGNTNPNVLTFNFAPTIVVLLGAMIDDQYHPFLGGIAGFSTSSAEYNYLVCMNLLSTEYKDRLGFLVRGNTYGSNYAKKSADGRELYWYHQKSASHQANQSGETYYYAAIGYRTGRGGE